MTPGFISMTDVCHQSDAICLASAPVVTGLLLSDTLIFHPLHWFVVQLKLDIQPALGWGR
jgi:hypothetical protein